MDTVVPPAKKNNTWLICSIAAVVLIGLITLVCISVNSPTSLSPKRTVSVADYREHIEKIINNQLMNTDNNLRKMVEDAHLTVTVTQAYVSDCRILTKDGSKNAGSLNGKNVRSVSMKITTRWDGNIHKNGKTIIGLTMENIGGKIQITESKIIYTDALVNIADPKFWYNVGFAIGTLIFI